VTVAFYAVYKYSYLLTHCKYSAANSCCLKQLVTCPVALKINFANSLMICEHILLMIGELVSGSVLVFSFFPFLLDGSVVDMLQAYRCSNAAEALNLDQRSVMPVFHPHIT